jgi:hypothetical protein
MAAILGFRLTTPTSGTVMSLGGANTVTAVSGTAMNNLYDNVTPDEATAGNCEYRALDIYNSGDADATNITFWFTQPTSNVRLRAWLETANSGGNHAASTAGAWTGLTVANEDTAPAGSGMGTGSTAMEYTVSSKLTISTAISATNACRIWIQRYVPSGTGNSANETATMTLEYA